VTDSLAGSHAAGCGCPLQKVSQGNSQATFNDLDLEEEYFPMIARTDPQSFFGLPPRGIKPTRLEARSSVTAPGGQTPDSTSMKASSDNQVDTETPINPELSGGIHLEDGDTEHGASIQILPFEVSLDENLQMNVTNGGINGTKAGLRSLSGLLANQIG